MTIYDKYEVVIGLEVHAQMSTKTKAFCGDDAAFGGLPNTHISPISLAHPGTLPKMNEAHLKSAVKLGIATNCHINTINYFDRKNYFYPDLPKGYQITQDNQPVCVSGSVNIRLENSTKSIRLNRIHMEEDAGKSIHDLHPKYTMIDLNRAGVPLLEIVSEPDLRSPEEASIFVATIRQLVRYLGVCDGNMEEGSLRCDCNVSVRLHGETAYGTRTEVKNVNSISNVKTAIAFEIKRQIDLIEAGESVVQQTRTFDAATGKTAALRTKEDAHDYRYFPEPDLPPIIITEAKIADWQAEIEVLPEMLFQQFTTKFELSEYDTIILTEEKEMALYFLELIKSVPNYKIAANWMINTVRSFLNDNSISISDFVLTPQKMAELIKLVETDKVGFLAAKQTLFPALIENPKAEVLALAKTLNIIQNDDDAFLETLVSDVLSKYPAEVAEYKACPKNKKGEKRKKGLSSLFIGEIMKQSKGKANVKVAMPILMKLLNR